MKNLIKSVNPMHFFTVALVAACLLMPEMALAQGGFADKTGTMLKDIATGIQIVVGIVATIALMWQFAEGYMGRKTWADIFTTSAWIIGAGAAIVLATWIFDAGKTITF